MHGLLFDVGGLRDLRHFLPLQLQSQHHLHRLSAAVTVSRNQHNDLLTRHPHAGGKQHILIKYDVCRRWNVGFDPEYFSAAEPDGIELRDDAIQW